MPDRFISPEAREAELHSELVQAVTNKDYDSVIELAQTLKGLRSPQSTTAERTPSPRPEVRVMSSPSQDKYDRFTRSGFTELRENERPLFLKLDIEAPTSVGSTKKTLQVTPSKQAAFILFPLDAQTGEVYPNSQISFTEAMKYLWPELHYDNWRPENRYEVQPVAIRKSKEGV